MKMVMIVYDAAFDDRVRETLDGCGSQGFTLWRRVLGSGRRSEPKMDDSVWPGYNNALMAAVEAGACFERLLKGLAELHEALGGKGLKVFTWPLEKVI